MCSGLFLNVPNMGLVRFQQRQVVARAVAKNYRDVLTEILPKDTVNTSTNNVVPYGGVVMAISESRAAAASTHFRVQYPNSRPRRIKIVGLGDGGGRIAQSVGLRGLVDVEIIKAGNDFKDHADAVIKGITDDARELLRPLQEAEIIFIVAVSGDQVEFARVVSRIARGLGKLLTGVLIEKNAKNNSAQAVEDATTLDTLRACVDMLVIGSDESYLDEMLSELGAIAA